MVVLDESLKAEVQCVCLTKRMRVPVSEPCIDAQIKHMINKINSTSPLLVTQHRDQGMWKWKQ